MLSHCKFQFCKFLIRSEDSATNSLLSNIPSNRCAEIGFLLGLKAKKSSVAFGIIKEESSLVAQSLIPFSH